MSPRIKERYRLHFVWYRLFMKWEYRKDKSLKWEGNNGGKIKKKCQLHKVETVLMLLRGIIKIVQYFKE